MCGAFQVETVNGNGVGLFGRFVNIDTGLFDCAVGEWDAETDAVVFYFRLARFVWRHLCVCVFAFFSLLSVSCSVLYLFLLSCDSLRFFVGSLRVAPLCRRHSPVIWCVIPTKEVPYTCHCSSLLLLLAPAGKIPLLQTNPFPPPPPLPLLSLSLSPPTLQKKKKENRTKICIVTNLTSHQVS